MVTIAVVLTIFAVGYLFSIRAHPYTACRFCKGGSRHRAAIFSYSYRPCRHCKGSGRKRRFGAQLLGHGQ
jgi:DnaJ-class molecular chaperone